ncbi:MFS transporter [Streptomyces sp. NPDC001500]
MPVSLDRRGRGRGPRAVPGGDAGGRAAERGGWATSAPYVMVRPREARAIAGSSAGLYLLPVAAGIVSARLAARGRAERTLAMAGSAVAAVAFLFLAALGTDTSLWLLRAHLLLIGMGFGLLLGRLIQLVQDAAPHHRLGVATTGVRFFQTLGTALGHPFRHPHHQAPRRPRPARLPAGRGPAGGTGVVRLRHGHGVPVRGGADGGERGAGGAAALAGADGVRTGCGRASERRSRRHRFRPRLVCADRRTRVGRSPGRTRTRGGGRARRACRARVRGGGLAGRRAPGPARAAATAKAPPVSTGGAFATADASRRPTRAAPGWCPRAPCAAPPGTARTRPAARPSHRRRHRCG